MGTNERGVTIVEMIGVMAIIGVLAVSVWDLIGSAMFKYRISQSTIQVQTLAKGVSRFYASAGNYDGLKESNAVQKLIDNGIPLPGMVSGNNSLRHAFGGSIEIKPVSYTNTEDYGKSCDSFKITFKSLSKRVCLEMAGVSWPEGDAANLISIQVGNDKYTWPALNADGSGKVLPLTSDKAMTSCKNGNVDVSWEFR